MKALTTLCCARAPARACVHACVPRAGGLWSPSRPGVFFTSQADGTLNVWDLFYRTSEPSLQASRGLAGLLSQLAGMPSSCGGLAVSGMLPAAAVAAKGAGAAGGVCCVGPAAW